MLQYQIQQGTIGKDSCILSLNCTKDNITKDNRIYSIGKNCYHQHYEQQFRGNGKNALQNYPAIPTIILVQVRLAQVLKTIFNQCVIYTCS